MKLVQQLHYLFFAQRVEPRRGLVEYQYAGLGDYYARNRDAALLSARQIEGGLVLNLVVVEPDDFDAFPYGFFNLLGAQFFIEVF